MAGFLGYCVQCLDVVKGEHTTLPYRGFVADVTPQGAQSEAGIIQTTLTGRTSFDCDGRSEIPDEHYCKQFPQRLRKQTE